MATFRQVLIALAVAYLLMAITALSLKIIPLDVFANFLSEIAFLVSIYPACVILIFVLLDWFFPRVRAVGTTVLLAGIAGCLIWICVAYGTEGETLVQAAALFCIFQIMVGAIGVWLARTCFFKSQPSQH